MARKSKLKEDAELQEIRQAELLLNQRHRECVELPKKFALKIHELETTMPPLAMIEDRRRELHHLDIVTRGRAANVLRDHNRSLTLLFVLLAATGSLIWWGVQLMQG